eukprot:TRINITY_DN5041_c0_g3_i1.p1 TRINITY_DN5041_c0_g3~~TRINITY_DN5041_c0_g3_i1.p1  ORF type:complete len:256 (-),score=62.50 TRINITY_DN5041_c0_g3_i1:2544-3311(-)
MQATIYARLPGKTTSYNRKVQQKCCKKMGGKMMTVSTTKQDEVRFNPDRRAVLEEGCLIGLGYFFSQINQTASAQEQYKYYDLNPVAVDKTITIESSKDKNQVSQRATTGSVITNSKDKNQESKPPTNAPVVDNQVNNEQQQQQKMSAAPLDSVQLDEEAQKRLINEEEERRKAQRKKKKGRIRELEEIRSTLAEKEIILLGKEKELLEKEQSIEVLQQELELERKLRTLLTKEKERAEEEAALAMGLCVGGGFP